MIDLEAIEKRYWDWYCPPDKNCCPRDGDWSDMDEGESKSHCIVRNDVPEMLDHIRNLEAMLAEIKRRDPYVLD